MDRYIAAAREEKRGEERRREEKKRGEERNMKTERWQERQSGDGLKRKEALRNSHTGKNA
jgi:hypothetical protein